MKRPPKSTIVHGPTVVGDISPQLCRALRRFGIDTLCLAYESHRFGFKPDRTLWHTKHGLIRREFIRLSTVFRVALRYDIIHFNYGTTMAMPSLPVVREGNKWPYYAVRRIHSWYTGGLQVLEIRLLRLLRRRVFVTYQGDDVRQGDVSVSRFAESIAHHVDSAYYHPASDKAKRRRTRRLVDIAENVFYLNPDLAHVLPENAIFLPYCHVNPDELPITTRTKAREPESLTVVHAPSHRGAKGTEVIIQIIDELKKDGHKIDFRLLEDLDNSQVGVLLDQADLLIDQLYAGWYGGIAVEAMFRGVPVMSFLRYDDFGVLPPRMVQDLPVINVTSQTLKRELSLFLSMNENRLISLRESSRKYASSWHNPFLIAQKVAAVYQL